MTIGQSFEKTWTIDEVSVKPEPENSEVLFKMNNPNSSYTFSKV